jgi:hypothetical protein
VEYLNDFDVGHLIYCTFWLPKHYLET